MVSVLESAETVTPITEHLVEQSEAPGPQIHTRKRDGARVRRGYELLWVTGDDAQRIALESHFDNNVGEFLFQPPGESEETYIYESGSLRYQQASASSYRFTVRVWRAMAEGA